ncbi:Cullin-4, partial [Thalictrum thalictroides]
ISTFRLGVNETVRDVKVSIDANDSIHYDNQALYLPGSEDELNDDLILVNISGGFGTGLKIIGSVYSTFKNIENLKAASCVSNSDYPKGRNEMALPVFQNIVLMLFNNALELSVQDTKDNRDEFGSALYLIKLRLNEELEKCLLCLDSDTRKTLMETTKEILDSHISAIPDRGITMLMDGNGVEDMWRLYALFSRLNNAFEVLRHALCSYIMDEEKEGDLLSSLREFKTSIEMMLEESFSRNDWFTNTTKDAFEHLINLRQPAELIANFLDEKLRVGNKGTSEEELEGLLDKVLVLFRFIQGKDVFEALYKKNLAKRLLRGKNSSIDAEKSIISKLKTECGSQYTHKLEGMFKDIELSKEINDSFKQSYQVKSKLSGIEMSVHVLTTGCWPTYPPMDVRLPHELNVYQNIFKEFYSSIYPGRHLTWQNSLGHCVLKAQFPKGRKELTVVLLLFNDAPKLSFQDIKDSTGIEDKELKRTLQSLACGKVRVLEKIPKGREVADNDYFLFNDEFSAPLYRIKVNTIQLKETVEESASTTERVFQDRPYRVDAAIIRLMKAKKVLSHPLLVTELFQQLNFPVKMAYLKKRIESLIDREYLERDENDPFKYKYLA